MQHKYQNLNSTEELAMGKKKDLSASEQAKIIKLLGRGHTANSIAKIQGRDVRTIRKFITRGKQERKRRNEAKVKKITRREMVLLKREVARNPLSSSAALFKAAGIGEIPRTTRCRILQAIGTVKKAKKRPPLNSHHREKRMEWCQKYLKADFKWVLWTDEMRATLDGPDGWARGWILEGTEAPTRIRRQQGGGGVMIWAGVIDEELVGPFRVPDGVKMNSEAYCQFLDQHLMPWLRKKRAAIRKRIILMQDNAPSHASKYSREWLCTKGFNNDKIMDWPACSPDINCIENFWSALKQRVYRNGKQFSSKEQLWKAIQAAAKSFSNTEIEHFTKSMDARLIKVIQNKGGHISY